MAIRPPLYLTIYLLNAYKGKKITPIDENMHASDNSVLGLNPFEEFVLK